jgi:Putative prokaryotic signal transducing protein
MHDANLIVVHTCNTQSEAEMAKSALEAAGIDAMIQADSAGGMRPHLAWASGGFKLLVREDDASAAHDVLDV